MAAPNDPVVGVGLLPGYPELGIGNDSEIVETAEGTSGSYSSPPSPATINGCQVGVGIGDVASPPLNEFTFYFLAPTTVNLFEFTFLDWGDNLPYVFAGPEQVGVVVVAYNPSNLVVATASLGFTRTSQFNTTEFGDRFVSGDACTAVEPGVHRFVLAAPGIAKVTLRYLTPRSLDPGVGIAEIFYNVGIGKLVPHSIGWWKTHDWGFRPEPVTVSVGGVDYTEAQGRELLRKSVRTDMTLLLAQHVLAATLNELSGVENSCIEAALAAANAFLVAHPVGSGVRSSSPEWKSISATVSRLTAFNSGRSC